MFLLPTCSYGWNAFPVCFLQPRYPDTKIEINPIILKWCQLFRIWIRASIPSIFHALRKGFWGTMMSTCPTCASQTFPSTLGMAGVEGNAPTRVFVPSPRRQNFFPRTVSGLGSWDQRVSFWNNLTQISLHINQFLGRYKWPSFYPLGLVNLLRPQDAKRFLEPEELLSSHILPVTAEQGRLCGAPPLCLQGIPKTQRARMAGNSMNATCIGAMLLAACLTLEAIWETGQPNSCLWWFKCPMLELGLCNSEQCSLGAWDKDRLARLPTDTSPQRMLIMLIIYMSYV